MINYTEDLYNYRNNVVECVKKLFGGEQVTKEEVMSLARITNGNGLRIDPYMAELILSGSCETPEECVANLVEGIILEVHNTFRGHYGI